MNHQLWTVIFFSAYFVLFLGAVLGIGAWQIKRRREKPPLEFRLLRGPGEALRARMSKFGEEFISLILIAGLVPLIGGLVTLGALVTLAPHMRLYFGLLIVLAVMVPLLLFTGRSALSKLMRFRDDRLGYLGERAVGEALVPLLASGYRIFHDIPAEANGAKFNVDHVAVGPTGMFAIETKTRRKGRVRQGFEAHKVIYDGRQLIWPWGEDSYGLKNAADRARWLSEKLNQLTGLGIAVKPVLALPGWYVVTKGIGPVTVLNHKQLPDAIVRGQQDVLTEQQVDLISRQLDQMCRDVEE